MNPDENNRFLNSEEIGEYIERCDMSSDGRVLYVPWRPWEQALLEWLVRRHGNRWRAVRSVIRWRSDDSIRNRCKRQKEGLRKRPTDSDRNGERAYWTREEDKLLKQLWGNTSMYMIQKRLPGRCGKAIRNRCYRLMLL